MKKFSFLLESIVKNDYIEIDENLFYINNITENEFNVFNKNNLYSILKPSDIRDNKKIYSEVITKEDFNYIICSIGVITFDDLFKSSFHYDSLHAEHSPNQKGIIFFKKRNLDLVKRYDSIKDLNNSNIGLFIEKGNTEMSIIAYEIDKFINPIQTISKKSILFYCVISKNQDVAFNGSKVIITVSRKDVNGQKIMYPFAVYFADNSILISDRITVSQLAKKVWKDFFSHQNVLYPYAPLDNKLFPLTPQKNDDSKIFTTIEKDLRIIIKEKFNSNNQKFLLKILDCKTKEDLLKLENIPSDIKVLVKNMIDSNQTIKPIIVYKFLYDLIIDHFKIDLSEIRKTNYLDWAYKINPSIKNTIKEIFTDLINNHLLVDIKDRNKKLLQYSNELWQESS